MSEPTYRVELEHDPASGSQVCWEARVYRHADDEDCYNSFLGSTREEAFDKAQAFCRALAMPKQSPSTVYLSEDGDIIDPHEVQR